MRFFKWFKIPLWIISSFLLLILVYFLVALGISAIPVKNNQIGKGELDIYLETNGVHTDLVLPACTVWKDWSKDIPAGTVSGKNGKLNYIAFGWGDRGFYMDTPEWSDLKFQTAFNAIFGLGKSAMHIMYYPKPIENNECRKIRISSQDYLQMVKWIESSFRRDQNNKVIRIKTKAVYGPTDAFYEAEGHYHLFNTCNSWTNHILKAGNQKACWWTPFDWPIMNQYR